MSLITDTTSKIFNLAAISRGDCVRVRRGGDYTFKNGFVTKTSEKEIQILYSNTQNGSTSYLTILAADAAAGVWEVYWTSDFQTINYEYNGADSNA